VQKRREEREAEKQRMEEELVRTQDRAKQTWRLLLIM
jgi:hypothetical protein